MLTQKQVLPVALSILLIVLLSACNKASYQIQSHLSLDDAFVGPSALSIQNGQSIEFPVNSKDINVIRYTLSENQQQVDLTVQLIFRQGDFVNINTLPSFSILPNGDTSSMEYLDEETATNIAWSVSVFPS